MELLEDVTLSSAIVIQKALTLNLNGHTIFVTEDTTYEHGFYVTKGGSLSLSGTGKIDVSGSDIWAFQVVGNTDSASWADTTAKTVLTIGPDITVTVAEGFCAWVAGKGAVLNVYGSLNSPGDSAIYGNGTRNATTNNGGTEINIFDGASVIAKSVSPSTILRLVR